MREFRAPLIILMALVVGIVVFLIMTVEPARRYRCLVFTDPDATIATEYRCEVITDKHGTWYTVGYARKRGKPAEVLLPLAEEVE